MNASRLTTAAAAVLSTLAVGACEESFGPELPDSPSFSVVVLGEPEQITSSPAHEVLPTISERWIVWTVWLGPSVGHSGIFAYDRTTNSPYPVPWTAAGDREISLSGDRVAFTRQDAIHALDLTTGNLIAVPPSGGSYQGRPDVSGDLIVWDDYLQSRGGGYDLFLYDVATESMRPIVQDEHGQLRSRVFGGRVVWEDARSSSCGCTGALDIFMLDVPTWKETPIADTPGQQYNAHINGDVVAWQSGGNIHAYDVGTGVYDVATGPSSQWLGTGEPISGTRIVYYDDRNGNDDVFMYDLATKTETQITFHPADQSMASIFGNYIVYADNQNGNWDIYQVEISSASFQVLDALIDSFVASGAISNAGIAEALRALSDQAAAALERGSTQAAIKTLGAFLRLLDGQTGVHVSPEAAEELTDVVGAIVETL